MTPIVEYASPAWSPFYQKNKTLIERIQRRFTKLIPQLKTVSYEERLKETGLWSLEERRNLADLIEVYKSWKNLSGIPFSLLFEKCIENQTRGHSMKLVKHRCTKDLRKYFFSEKIIDSWNSLDQLTIDSNSVNVFKNNLSRLRRNKIADFWNL